MAAFCLARFLLEAGSTSAIYSAISSQLQFSTHTRTSCGVCSLRSQTCCFNIILRIGAVVDCGMTNVSLGIRAITGHTRPVISPYSRNLFLRK